jgi:SAM-dependent methyltransferase
MSCIFDTRDAGVPLAQNHEPQTVNFEELSHPARRCMDCGHVFFDPPPLDLLDRYYNGEYPAAAASWYNVEADYADAKVTSRADRILSIASGFGFARPETKEIQLYHEIGCAFGGTVHELNRRGYPATGTELNAGAVAQGRARGNDAIAAEPDVDFLQRAGRQPNVVFGFHSFEHMPDPVGYLRDLAPCLASDSIVILFVPNAMALFPTAYGFMRYIWFGFPGHLNLFSAGSALCVARAAGYELLDVASHLSGLEPEATDHALNSRIETPVMARIRDHLVENGLMAEELILILTPAGSPAALRHRAELAATTRRCTANAAFEAAIRELGETAALGELPAAGPALVELLQQCQFTLEQRDAQLADALRRVKETDEQIKEADERVKEAHGRVKEAHERAKEADLLRRTIETSTLWRATRGVRLVADWLKPRGTRHPTFGDTAPPAGEQLRR